jgi:hypothetical protein
VTDNLDTKSEKNNSKNSHEYSAKMAKIKTKAKKLSDQDTREILTPFAFKIDKSLFGISLAVPWRRGAALLIDLFLVAILSGAPGELLALLVAITLYNIGSKKHAKKLGKVSSIRETILRVFAAVIVFVILIDILPRFFSQLETFNNHVEQAEQSQSTFSASKNNQSNAQNITDQENNDFIKATLTLAAGVAISHSECEQYSCWQQLTQGLSSAYAELTTSTLGTKKFDTNLLKQVNAESSLSEQEIAQLNEHLQKSHKTTESKQQFTKQKIEKKLAFDSAEPTNVTSTSIKDKAGDLSTLNEETSNKVNDVEPANPSIYKGFAWLQGLVDDLGLGFGWAAFYFTMFTALWYGQTPGKKLFSIRVVQLDGTLLSVWDSFGRYGGYGAGIATGLLGFAQIFWDPNRQAIHDKISSTIVVSDNRTDRKINKKHTDESADD